MHAFIGKSTGIKLPPTSSLRCFHASLEGQLGSAGRTRRMAGLANALRGHKGESDTAPDAFKNSLRFKAAPAFVDRDPYSPGATLALGHIEADRFGLKTGLASPTGFEPVLPP